MIYLRRLLSAASSPCLCRPPTVRQERRAGGGPCWATLAQQSLCCPMWPGLCALRGSATTLLQLQKLRAASQVRPSLLHRSQLCGRNSVQLHLLHLCSLHCFLLFRTVYMSLHLQNLLCCTVPSQA